MPLVCAFNGPGGCTERGHTTVHNFSPMVQEFLQCVGVESGHLCSQHRAISQCSSCGHAVQCFGSSALNLALKQGIDFDAELRELNPQHVYNLGRLCEGTVGDFDQFHPRLTARICPYCRRVSTKRGKAKEEREEKAAARVEQEATRAAAARKAAAPDTTARVRAQPAPKQRTRTVAASEDVPRPFRQGRRSQEKVCLPPPLQLHTHLPVGVNML